MATLTITFVSVQSNFRLASYFIFTILYTKGTHKKNPILFQLLKLLHESLRLSHLFYLWKDSVASPSKKQKKKANQTPLSDGRWQESSSLVLVFSMTSFRH